MKVYKIELNEMKWIESNVGNIVNGGSNDDDPDPSKLMMHSLNSVCTVHLAKRNKNDLSCEIISQQTCQQCVLLAENHSTK